MANYKHIKHVELEWLYKGLETDSFGPRFKDILHNTLQLTSITKVNISISDQGETDMTWIQTFAHLKIMKEKKTKTNLSHWFLNLLSFQADAGSGSLGLV